MALLISANAKQGITLANPSGFIKNKGYLHIPLPSDVLAPQQTIGNIVVAFHNASGKKFNFGKKVISGFEGNVPLPPNHIPVAKIGLNQIVAVNSVIDLNGGASSDPEGQALIYRWALLSKPQNSNATLLTADQPHNGITIDQNGRYKIQLIVNDGQVDSFPAVIELDTANSAPWASIVSSHSVPHQGDNIDFNGSGSYDLDLSSLSYSWTLPVKPRGSKARLSPGNQSHSQLTIDKKGSYTARLVVNDGLQNSLPATLTVTTNNSLPVANAGNDIVDQLLNQTLTLSGSLSSDADNDPLQYKWSLLYKPANSSALLSAVDRQDTDLTPDVDGSYIAQLIVNDGFNNSEPDTVEITAHSIASNNHAPSITSHPPSLSVIAGQRFDYSVIADDPDGDALSYSLLQAAPGMTINPASGAIAWTTSLAQSGEFAISIQVSDGHGGSDTQTFMLSINAALAVAPDLAGKTLSEALTLIMNAGLKEGTVSYDYSGTVASGYVVSQSIVAGSQAAYDSPVNLLVSLGSQENALPPDPANIAPAVDPTTTTTVASSAAFLYSGAHPIQTNVNAEAIEAKRAAVIRGKVLDIQSQPLAGVAVSILNHPEFGKTLSRADGQFDMVVNGGSTLTINYVKTGLLPAQRQTNVSWQDYTVVQDVVLKALDNEVTSIEPNTTGIQVARGSMQTDNDGSRQATIFFPAGTTASMTLPDGSQQALSTFHVRATEYTVGENGPTAMPGELPATSGYTYAVEYSVDEAQAVGATEVTFNQPVISYNENFLNFPVGETVPSGYYDRTLGKWKADSSGIIVKIAAINNGVADLIIDDSNAAASETELANMGVILAERQQLATLYQAGQTLWRVSLSHFSPWDFNWARRLPPGARSPSEKSPSTKKPDNSCPIPGCIIGAQNQTLSDEQPLVGTPYYLRYDSDRQSGYLENNTVTIPLIGGQLPPVKRIDLTVRIAGQQHAFSFPAQANQTTQFTWDGKDVYGRTLQGQQIAFTDLGYVYDATVQQTITFAESGTGVQLTGDNARNEVTLHQTQSAVLGNFNAGKLALGGWTLNVHHYYDPIGRVLYQGDGTRRSVQGVANIITTAATSGFGDLGYSLAVGADGSLYYADRARIHKIDPQGNRSVVAGTGESGYSGDGGPAVNAKISSCAQYVNIANDGSLIFFEGNCFGLNRIRKIDPNGIITTLAGTGNGEYATPDPAGIPGNEFPLIAAIPRPAPDGSVYIADQGRLWKLGTDGRVREVKIDYSADDAGPGNLKIADFAVGADGSIYIMDTGLIASNFLIRKLTPDGKIHLLAGTNQRDSNRDGGPALAADIWPSTNGGIAVSPSGDVYFSEGDSVIRKIGTDGIISQFAGNRVLDYTGDGGPATQASIRFANALAFGPDGALYMADGHIRRVGPTLPGYDANNLSVPSEDGSELFIFDASGKHLKTVNTLTGATVTEFSYDSDGRLIRVTDGDNNVTTIERDTFGNPTGIVSPYNQRTALAVNGNGYFSSITNPANETDSFTYSNNGLLLSKKDPSNNLTAFAYDTLGRLLSDTNALNNQQTLAKSGTDNDYTVEHQSALGRKTDYRVQIANDGRLTNTVTAADGTQTQSTEGASGINQYSDAEGTTNSETLTGDPRWNMQSPYAKSATLSTGGLTANVTNSITATLTDPSNLLSLSALTQTSSINNRSYTSRGQVCGFFE